VEGLMLKLMDGPGERPNGNMCWGCACIRTCSCSCRSSCRANCSCSCPPPLQHAGGSVGSCSLMVMLDISSQQLLSFLRSCFQTSLPLPHVIPEWPLLKLVVVVAVSKTVLCCCCCRCGVPVRSVWLCSCAAWTVLVEAEA
jgi:hypothetical protein